MKYLNICSKVDQDTRKTSIQSLSKLRTLKEIKDQNMHQLSNTQLRYLKPVREQKTQKIKKLNFKIVESQKENKKAQNLLVHSLNHMSCRYAKKVKKEKLPNQILSVLFRQNIQNYSPYLETLARIDNFQKKLSFEKISKIKKLCYIGIAQNFIKSKKYKKCQKYSRMNILIRTYMLKNIRAIVEENSENYENVVYIPCNSSALTFTALKCPLELKELITEEKFHQVIENINKTISKNYTMYKNLSNTIKVKDSWGQNIAYCLIVLMLVCFFFSGSHIFIFICTFFIVILLIAFFSEYQERLSNLGFSKSIIEKIENEIEKYFATISTHKLEWKIGIDFYWIEIHYINKKKKRVKVANK